MKNQIPQTPPGRAWLAFAFLVAVLFASTGQAQRPGDQRPPPGGRGGRGGPPGGLERAVDDLNLPADKRQVIIEAVRASQDDMRRINDLAVSDLLLKLKAVLGPDDFRKVREETDRLRGTSPLGGDDVTARILSFDKTQSGRVTRDDLPERMQSLVARGDLNQDGALDREEIKKLAASLPREEPDSGNGPGGRGNPPGRGRGGPGRPIVPAGAIDRVVGDLNLSGPSREAATAALVAHRENLRKLTEFAQADLKLIAGEVLNQEEYKRLTEMMSRQPSFNGRPGGPGGGRGGPGRPGFRPPPNP